MAYCETVSVCSRAGREPGEAEQGAEGAADEHGVLARPGEGDPGQALRRLQGARQDDQQTVRPTEKGMFNQSVLLREVWQTSLSS